MQFIACCYRVEGLQPLDVPTETHGRRQAYIPVLHTCHLRRLGYWWYLMWMIACRTLLFHIPLLRSLLTCFGYIISPCLESKAMHSHYLIQKSYYYIQLVNVVEQSSVQYRLFSWSNRLQIGIDNPFLYSPFCYRVFSLEGSLVIDWLSERRPEHVVWLCLAGG